MLIKDINTETKTRSRANGELTDEIQTPTGLRQGDSLRPALFNTVMNKIIESVKGDPGYQLEDSTSKQFAMQMMRC